MPILSADQAKSEYDVVIVGSGAGGGQAAYTLTLAGLKCVMLEAGRSYDVVAETPMFNPPNEAPLMGNATPDKPFGVYDTNEGLENTPNSPEGVLLPAPKGRAAELLAQKHGRKLGIPVVSIHRAVLTKHLDYRTIPQKLHPGNEWAQKIVRTAMAERNACFWATPCGRGCNVGANYQ